MMISVQEIHVKIYFLRGGGMFTKIEQTLLNVSIANIETQLLQNHKYKI